MLNIDINEGLNVSNVGDKFPRVVLPETDQIRLVCSMIPQCLKKKSEAKGSITEDSHLKEYFCSKTVFNLSINILTETEIGVLENGLDFALIQKTLNESKFRKIFEEFSRRIRCKWDFRNEPTNKFSEIPAFRPKFGWKSPKAHASLKVFLSLVEKELFSDEMNDSTQSNLTGEE